MTDNPDYPHWAYPTRRAWKAQKRADIRAARKAIDALRNGCAMLPDADLERAPVVVERIARQLDALAEACSMKEWGR